MPNIKSAKKRTKVNSKKSLRNQMVKNAMRTDLKKFHTALENKETVIPDALAEVTRVVDKATAKGVLHRNKAARLKSQLARKANAAG
ncbi:MAG: 30S ribosomal protein S20 [Clostridiales bacterium]|nr:30S ribosomal protein S20 [Clostridiales bacterium]